jgi:hypothetical protein
MIWTTIDFGKHKGKSLPQIIFKDADWFFHAYENDYFKGVQAREVNELYRRARSIKVPQRNGQKMLIEYFTHYNGKFGMIQLIPAGPDLGRLNVASSIDFYMPKSHSPHDKTGYKNFVFSLKAILFGDPSRRMNRRACEDFFNNEDNFDLDYTLNEV